MPSRFLIFMKEILFITRKINKLGFRLEYTVFIHNCIMYFLVNKFAISKSHSFVECLHHDLSVTLI